MDQKNAKKRLAINVNLDTTPILYTDNIIISVNNYGIVLDIGQKLGPTNQMRIVARAGMSREHAKKFLNEMGKLLLMTEGQGQTGPSKRAN